jgi:dTDP-4-dehydrorhamnose 3,5-epimerase
MIYFHTAAYHPGTERGLNIQDPKPAIQWPLLITERSARDMAHPMLAQDFTGVAA